MIRTLDFILSVVGLLIGSPLLLIIYVILLFDAGSPIFMQKRVGKFQRPFTLIKFRTMKLNTPSMPTHLNNIDSITSFGHFLRKTKLDELPQLWNVMVGEMSFVGPRPGLLNHQDLIHERELRGIYNCRPGITGLAQVQGIDMSNPILLAETDQKMIKTLTLINYLKYILQTLIVIGFRSRIITK